MEDSENADPAKYELRPKPGRYGCLEIDEFWTFAGPKKNRKWLVYACRRG